MVWIPGASTLRNTTYHHVLRVIPGYPQIPDHIEMVSDQVNTTISRVNPLCVLEIPLFRVLLRGVLRMPTWDPGCPH